MKICDAVDQIRDADTAAGAITNWLYAGDFTDKELRNTVEEVEDLASEMAALADKIADGATDGKKAEMGGWLDDAASNLCAAVQFLRINDINEACISLEAASENFMEACNAASH